MTDQRLSYCGRIVYVGIDVHKETYTVTCVCNKQIVKTATVQADPAALAASLPRWFPGATLYSVYEAGFSAFLARIIQEFAARWRKRRLSLTRRAQRKTDGEH